MSASLFVSGLAASFGARPLFAGLDLTLAPGDVTALVGVNGAGKTTLMRIIAGEHSPDAGSVRFAPPDATVGYLPQSAPDPAESVLGYALRRTGVGPAAAAYERAAHALADGVPGADDAYAHAFERWLALGGADLDTRLAEVVARVGLGVDLERPLGTLSGGQAARAALASILVSQYDILLLDEPTNNLDAAGLAEMTEFVRQVSSPVLIASHDRRFLDQVATSVLEIDIRQQAVRAYNGGWSEYREAKTLARRLSDEAYQTYLDQRDDLLEDARRKTEWAAKGRAKAAQLGPHMHLARQHKENKARKMDQRAARTRDAVERLAEVEQPRKEWELRYTIAAASGSAEVVVTLDQVVVRNGGFVVGPVSLQVARGDRIALLGDNGSGKTTLLDAVLGRRPPASGRIAWGSRVSTGIIDQDRSIVSGAEPLIEAVKRELATTDDAETRTLLAKFGLSAEHIARPCDTLSLGERTRAALAVLQGRAVNVVVLDEPTNHLDVEAIEALQSALEAFSGTLLLVTHDRALRDAVGITAVWQFTRDADHATVAREEPDPTPG